MFFFWVEIQEVWFLLLMTFGPFGRPFVFSMFQPMWPKAGKQFCSFTGPAGKGGASYDLEPRNKPIS